MSSTFFKFTLFSHPPETPVGGASRQPYLTLRGRRPLPFTPSTVVAQCSEGGHNPGPPWHHALHGFTRIMKRCFRGDARRESEETSVTRADTGGPDATHCKQNHTKEKTVEQFSHRHGSDHGLSCYDRLLCRLTTPCQKTRCRSLGL